MEIESKILEVAKKIEELQKIIESIDKKEEPQKYEDTIREFCKEKVLLRNLKREAYLEMEPTIVGEDIDLYLENIESKIEEKPNKHSYIITLHNTKTIIGNIELRFLLEKQEEKYGNIGAEIWEDYKGKRYSKKAFYLLQDVLLEHGVRKPIFTVEKTNTSSIISLEHIGANRLEDLHDSYYSYEYDLLEEEKNKKM